MIWSSSQERISEILSKQLEKYSDVVGNNKKQDIVTALLKNDLNGTLFAFALPIFFKCEGHTTIFDYEL